MHKIYNKIMVLCTLLFFSTPEAYGWYEKTHLAVAQITGYERWYNAAGADIAKLKAGRIEYNNHYFSNPDNSEITAELVLSQVKQYNDPADSDGHLYGAIIGALRGYEHSAREFKYAEHHIAYCVHYVGDLSQPLHNVVNDEFNLTHHDKNDGTVDGDVLDNLSEIRKYMHPVSLRPENFEQDLAGEIARIANFARYLALRLKKENRDMTREEAYRQLGHSASLLHAILQHFGKIP